MVWLFTLLGVAIITVGLFEVFQTLLHPAGKGPLSRLCVTSVWRLMRLMGSGAASIAGPVATVTVILFWTAIQTVGWALIHYPHLPHEFAYSAGIDPTRYGRFAEALYVSLMTLTTLGYGDVVPLNDWIRPLSALEALTGFALLTAALSWFMQIYPALARRRALAIRLTLLHKVDYANQMHDLDISTAVRTLEALATDVVQVRVDFTQTAESYYFRESTAKTSVAASLAYAVEISRQASSSEHLGVRMGGAVLQGSLDDLAEFVRDEFVKTGESTEDVFRAYASDHRYPYEE